MPTPTKEELIEALSGITPAVVSVIHAYAGDPLMMTFNGQRFVLQIYAEIPEPNFDEDLPIIIDWGDNTITVIDRNNLNDPNIEVRDGIIYKIHVYRTRCDHQISIYNASGICFKETLDAITINQWGKYKVTRGREMFADCSDITFNARDSPMFLTKCFSHMFRNSIIRGELIWDTVNITNMRAMFLRCKLYCHTLTLNTSNVTDMSHMFSECEINDISWNISEWNTSSCSNMHRMFYEFTYFNDDLSQWDTSRVTNMRAMFYGCNIFHGDLSNWVVNNVIDMYSMFYHCEQFNGDLSRWETGNATDMGLMFMGCRNFNGNLEYWNVGKVRNMNSMFSGCESFNGNLSRWVVCNVTDMSSMLEYCEKFNSDLSDWRLDPKTKTSKMVWGCPRLTNIPPWVKH